MTPLFPLPSPLHRENYLPYQADNLEDLEIEFPRDMEDYVTPDMYGTSNTHESFTPTSSHIGSRHFCPHESCTNPSTGLSPSFSRKADLSRHIKVTHEPRYLDCAWPKCDRVSSNGFTRIDHLIEHQRGYHNWRHPEENVSTYGTSNNHESFTPASSSPLYTPDKYGTSNTYESITPTSSSPLYTPDKYGTSNTHESLASISRHIGPRHLESRIPCPHPSCTDSSTGITRSYSRKADLARHVKSTHEPVYLDCPWPRCDRVGSNGFTRKEHLIEHRRGYHNDATPKRGVDARRGGSH